MHFLGIKTICLLCAAIIVAMMAVLISFSSGKGGDKVPVRITMLGSVTSVEGMAIEPHAATKSHYSAHLMDPGLVTIALPDGRDVSLTAKGVFIDAYYGVVAFVEVLPQENSLPYKDAVAELRRTLDLLDLRPDKRMEEMMALWPADSPGYDPVNHPGFYPQKQRAASDAITIDSRRTYLDVDLRPVPECGWYTVIRLCVDPETSRHLARSPSTQASDTQPSTTQSPVSD